MPIISIGFGNESYVEYKTDFRAIRRWRAWAGYFIGAQPHEINRIFEDISESIACSYRVSWEPKFENQDEVDLKLRVMYKDGEGVEHHDLYNIVIGRKI